MRQFSLLAATVITALLTASALAQPGTTPPCQDVTCAQPTVGFKCPTGMIWVRKNGQAACDWCDPATKPADDTQTTICTPPQTGSITQTRTYTCDHATNSWVAGPWSSTGSCTNPPTSTDCGSSPMSWGVNCSGTIPGAALGAQSTATNTVTGYTGSWTGTCMSTGGWQHVSSSCNSSSCPPPAPPGTQDLGCPPGYSGSHTQARDVSCVSGTWITGNWYDTANTCQPVSCPLPAPDSTQTLPCPSGQSGSITQTRTVQCSGTNWITGSWTTTSNTCTTPGCSSYSGSWGAACYGTVPARSVGQTGTATNVTPNYTGSATLLCTTNGFEWVSGNCDQVVCPPPEPDSTQTLPCPSGQTGSITQTRSVTCSGSTWNVGNWVTTSNTCNCTTTDLPWTLSCAQAGLGGNGTVTGVNRLNSCTGSNDYGGLTGSNGCCVSGFPNTQSFTLGAAGSNPGVSIPGCEPTACGAEFKTWGAQCSGMLPQTPRGNTATLSYNANNYSGSASWSCGSNGWVPNPGATCDPIQQTDYCLNVPGIQTSAAGYTSSNGGAPNGYCCPIGQTWSGSQCVSPEPTCRPFAVGGLCWTWQTPACDTNFGAAVSGVPGAAAIVGALRSQCYGGVNAEGSYGPDAKGSTGGCTSHWEDIVCTLGPGGRCNFFVVNYWGSACQ